MNKPLIYINQQIAVQALLAKVKASQADQTSETMTIDDFNRLMAKS